MSPKVDEDLKHIPKGAKGSTQNLLRMTYRNYRISHINITKTKEEVLKVAIAELKKTDPTFMPQYDSDYFKL